MKGDARIQSAIREITRRVVAGYAPERIILFGSYAYGEPDDDSDIDLLIIKDTEEHFIDRLARVRRAAAGAHRLIPFEPIVLTPEELDRRLRIGDQFFGEIVERGELLYARS